MIGRLEDQIRARTERILDDAAARGDVVLVPEIASQLPMHLVADIVDISEADRPEVFRLTHLIMRATDPFQEISTEEQRTAEVGLFTSAHELSAAKPTNPTHDVCRMLAALQQAGDVRPR